MSNIFLQSENKSILWDLMKGNEKFSKGIVDNFQHVQKLFEKTLEKIIKGNENKDLIELNKMFLSEMNNSIELKSVSLPALPVTSQELKANKLSDFENRLKKRQNDFEDSVKKDLPDEINFNDNYEEPILDIDDELQKKINERKYENLNITTDVEKAKEWIGIKEEDKVENKLALEVSADNEVSNIHENLGTENLIETFEEVDIFNKLKKVSQESEPIDNKIILEKLKRMDRKIDMIIEYVTQLINK